LVEGRPQGPADQQYNDLLTGQYAERLHHVDVLVEEEIAGVAHALPCQIGESLIQAVDADLVLRIVLDVSVLDVVEP